MRCLADREAARAAIAARAEREQAATQARTERARRRGVRAAARQRREEREVQARRQAREAARAGREAAKARAAEERRQAREAARAGREAEAAPRPEPPRPVWPLPSLDDGPGCRRLLAELVHVALLDLAGDDARLTARARGWINANAEGPWSFLWCAGQLGFDGRRARALVSTLSPAELAARVLIEFDRSGSGGDDQEQRFGRALLARHGVCPG